MTSTNDARQCEYWEAEHGFRRYDHPVVRAFATQRIQFISRHVDLEAVRTVLDVGCGAGVSSFYYEQVVDSVHGIDRSDAMLADNPLPRERLHRGAAENLPFPDDSFDLVNAWELLHHVEDPRCVLKEIARVSREHVVVFEPNRYNPALAAFALLDREHRWILRHSLRSLRRLAEGLGLDVRVARVVGCIFPNKTPWILLGGLKRIPFRLPVVGISNVLVCQKRGRVR